MKNIISGFLMILCVPLLAMAQTDTLWTRTLGGAQSDLLASVRETSDGGLVLAGETISFGAGLRDFWLVRMNGSGDTLWTRTYGGAGDDACYAVAQTSDGGFILAGRSNSFGGGWGGYVVRTNAQGDTLWTRLCGGASRDEFAAVMPTADNGFVLAGYTLSAGAGSGDFWLFKMNANGDSLWRHTYGGSRSDQCYALENAADGGFFLAGSTETFGGAQSGAPNFWLVKVSSSGDSLWSHAYGGTASDVCTSIAALGDGYALGGYTQSFGAGNSDFWVIKVSGVTGDSLTSRTFGTSRQDYCYSVEQSEDGGLVIAGEVSSEAMAGGANYWLLKADMNLDTLWNSVYGGSSVEHCRGGIGTSDGNFALTGSTYSFGTGMPNAWVVKSRTPTRTLAVYPDSLNYQTVPAGAQRDSILVIRNTGSYTIQLDSVSAPHGFTTNYPGVDIQVLPQMTYFLHVIFHPDSEGVFDDTLLIYSSVPASPKRVLLRGVGGTSAVPQREAEILPHDYALSAFPNPFNPTTSLALDLPKSGPVRLAVYDVTGREVSTLVNGVMTAGRYTVTLDGSALASGVYFVRMNATSFTLTRKLVLMK